MPRGPFCEARDHQLDKFGHALEPRMGLKTCVMFQLQKAQMIRKPAMLNTTRRKRARERGKWHCQQAFDIKLKFCRNAERPMRFEMPISTISKQDKEMV